MNADQTGDFNSVPTSICYQILKHHGFMTDTWLERHEEDSTPKDISNSIQNFGITCDSPLNTWTKHFLKQEPHVKEIGDRLDYIFYRKSSQIICQESRVVMEEYIPGTEWSYSDHFGVHSVFTLANNTTLDNFAPDPKQLARPDFTQLSPTHLNTAIEIIQREYNQAKKTGNQYLILLFVSVIVVVGAYIAQIFSYEGNTQTIVHVICGFIMISCSAFAMVCLIVGFVFGGTEQRSLDQYMIDLRVSLENLQKPLLTTLDGGSFSTTKSSLSEEEGMVVKPMLKKLR